MKAIKVSMLVLSAALALLPAAAHENHPHKVDDKVAADDMTVATVRKLDIEHGKITLKHEAIKSLGMPAMTMVFQIEEKSLFDGLAQGDNVRVKIEKKGTALIVTAIEKTQHSGH